MQRIGVFDAFKERLVRRQGKLISREDIDATAALEASSRLVSVMGRKRA